MFNSPKLPESPSTGRRLSVGTLDTYSNFRNHLLSDEASDNSEDDVNTFPAKIKQKVLQIPPLDLKLKKPLNRLLSDVQGINRSNRLSLNKKTKMETKVSNSNEGVSKKKKPTKIKPADNAVINKPRTRSTSRNKENNLPALSKGLVVPEKRSKRKLFDTEALSEQGAKKSKTVEDEKSIMNQTNKSLQGLSDTAVSIFMHNFDKEMAHELSDQPVTNLANGSAPLSTQDLSKAEHCTVFKEPNQRCYKKLPKRKSAKQSQKTVAQLLQEEVSLLTTKNNYDSDDSLHDKDFVIDECSSTSNESSFTDSEAIEDKNSSKTDDILVKEEVGSICSDTDSICSIASSTSRYGRVRKAPPVYINATIFGGNPRKSAEIKQKAASLINSHKCKSRTSVSIEDIPRFSPEHINFLSPIHKKMDSPEFKRPANQVTPSQNGLTARKSQSRTLSNASQKSFLIGNRSDKQTPNQFDFISPTNSKAVSLQLRNSANQTHSSANGSSLSNSRRSRSKSSNTSKNSSFITDLADKQTDCITPPCNKRMSPRLNQITPSASGNKIAIGSNDQHALKSPTNLKIGDTFLPEEIIFKKPFDKTELTCSSQNGETSTKSQKIVIHQNVVLRPPNEQERPVKHVKPSIYNLRQNTSLARASRSSVSQATFQNSNDDFEDMFDDLGRRPDPNEIHAVVNDEVVSFKWHAPTPDLDSILSDENIHYSMSDLKSFYTNVKVGYLKIDGGCKKLMKVLRDCIMLYFVERGEAVFRVSEREIAGQIGSTFFIPLGVDYTITNLKTEDLILKFVKMSPTTSVL